MNQHKYATSLLCRDVADSYACTWTVCGIHIGLHRFSESLLLGAIKSVLCEYYTFINSRYKRSSRGNRGQIVIGQVSKPYTTEQITHNSKVLT